MKHSTKLSITQIHIIRVLIAGLLIFLGCAPNAGYSLEKNMFEFRLEPGHEDLFAEAEYRIWIPDGVEKIVGLAEPNMPEIPDDDDMGGCLC